jgi:hypothetical protein
MRIRATLLLAVALQLLVAGALRAQQLPRSDLSGTWVINIAKSHFGKLPPPTVDSVTITQMGNMYQFDATTDFGGQGRQHLVYKWPVGAGEATNDVSGATVHTTITQHGDTLAVSSEVSMQGQTVAVQSGRVYRSPDGKTMTREADIRPMAGPSTEPIHLLFVYDRK